ncbi:MAG TPA: hypothetical protein PLL06_00565 [Acidobacteriota bacterium]|nr:hypothetical protein [Acidobacteriota bacterium]HMZ78159.1 hypothetical protein [Acidobacteriota bacterium]HNB69729.1 hypothetical protein [Acidobacteriota bacterium]HNC47019.1 hypothetical protein [Acidobacteriota bacterium]HND19506.1 hypothetical protein [Acidobacteriota bacterium]
MTRPHSPTLYRQLTRFFFHTCPVLILAVMCVNGISGSLAQAMAHQNTPSAVPKVRPTDVESVDAIIKTLYEVISGPAGQKRDWDRFRSLLHPSARLIPTNPTPTGGSEAHTYDGEGYIQRASAYFEKSGFYEREIARKSEQFGNIVQVFSTYESLHSPQDTKPFARGINSIQLLKDGNRWWVMTVFWDTERPDNPIPEAYLPKSKTR